MKRFSYRTKTATLLAGLALVASTALAACGGGDDDHAGSVTKVELGVDGNPPVPTQVIPFIADKQGYFQDEGLKVKFRAFQSGTSAARAVQAGQILVALAPTNSAVNLVGSGGDLVGIAGIPTTDWVLASTDPSIQKCEDLKGKTVGIDEEGGIQYLVMQQILESCHLTVDDIKTVSGAIGGAGIGGMVSGTYDSAIMHYDAYEAVLRQTTDDTHVVLAQTDIAPLAHEVLWLVKRKTLDNKKDREMLVKLLAARIRAAKYAYEPENFDAVLQLMADNSKRDIRDLKPALKYLLKTKHWATEDGGLDEQKIQNEIDVQVAAGNVKGTPPSVSDLVDTSLAHDAASLVASEDASK